LKRDKTSSETVPGNTPFKEEEKSRDRIHAPLLQITIEVGRDGVILKIINALSTP